VDIRVTEKPASITKCRVGTAFGPLLSNKKYYHYNCNMVNTLRGLIERVFRVNINGVLQNPLKCNEQVLQSRLSTEKKLLTSYAKLSPISIDSCLNLWTGSKRKIYERAAASLRFGNLTRRDGRLKTFVKCEKIDEDKDESAPRVIQPRDPRYNLKLACYLKPHEEEFYHRIDKMYDVDGLGDKTVFKGLSAVTAAEHMLLKIKRFNNPCFIGLDASRFDQHVSKTALEWEHSIYLESFNGRAELGRMLKWQVNQRGVAFLPEGRIDYTVEGRRASGDVNTSLGNCILMSSMVHAYMRPKNVKFALANNGDDCVLILERKHAKKTIDLQDWFRDIGFNIKREETLYDIRKVPFCQQHVLTSPGYNICVRDPNTITSKDLHTTHPLVQGQYLQWLTAVGECGRQSTKGVPVLNRFYQSFPTVDITNRSIAEEFEKRYQYKMIGGSIDTVITPEMRHSFWVAFNITPDEQEAIEQTYAHIEFSDKIGRTEDVPIVSYYRGL